MLKSTRAASLSGLLLIAIGDPGAALTLEGMNTANQLSSLYAAAQPCELSIDAEKLAAWAEAHSDGDPIGVANYAKATQAYLRSEIEAMPDTEREVHCTLIRKGAIDIGVLVPGG